MGKSLPFVRHHMKSFVASLFSIMPLVSISLATLPAGAIESDALVRYGTTYGECLGYCTKSIEVFPTRVAFFAIARHPTKKPASVISEILLSQQEQDEARHLVSSVSLDGLPERIGCPDCLDGGAEWIEVNEGSHRKRITFERGMPPVQVRSLANWLNAVQSRFPVPAIQ